MKATAVYLLIALLSVAAPGAVADGPDGGDAPNDWAGAWDLQPGSIRGRVNTWDDPWDWYRIEVPAGMDVHVWSQKGRHDSSWHYLSFREDDGTQIAETPPDYEKTAIVGVSTAALRIGVAGVGTGPSGYEMHLSLEPSLPQHDAGTGADAGNHWKHATPVSGPTRIVGTLHAGYRDSGDWYRIPVSTDNWTNVLVELTKPHRVEVRNGGGGLLQGSTVSDFKHFLVGPGRSSILVGLNDLDGYYGYTFTITSHARPEVAVKGIRVEWQNITTGAVEAPVGRTRTVVIDLVNDGAGLAFGGTVQLWVTHSDRPGQRQRVLHDGPGPIKLMPGEHGSLRFPWDSLGEVGSATVHARVDASFDLNGTDNARNRTILGPRGAPAGVDALNNEISLDDGELLNGHTSHQTGGTAARLESDSNAHDAWVWLTVDDDGDASFNRRICNELVVWRCV